MATFNVTCPLNKIVDVSLPGIPVPNTGVTLSANNPFTDNASITQLIPVDSSNFQIKAIGIGTTIVHVNCHNASNVGFTETIIFTVPNPNPDATASGITISAPHD